MPKHNFFCLTKNLLSVIITDSLQCKLHSKYLVEGDNSVMEEFNWIDMMEKMQDIRLFSSLNVRRMKKGGLTSSQEITMLSQIVFSDSPLTPLELTVLTGLSKSSVSRSIERLEKKEFIIKQYNSRDKRSYILLSTAKGNQELEQTYRYYLEPIYRLRRILGEERFDSLITQIKEANKLLQNGGVNK